MMLFHRHLNVFSIEDVQDFVGVMPKSSEATEEAPEVAPPTFAPLVAVLGLLRTFDWSTDFQFDYRDGTSPAFLPAFITVEKNPRIKEIKEKPLLKRKDKNILKSILLKQSLHLTKDY